MRDYQADIRDHRADFARVNTNSPESLRAWFDRTPYLTIHDRINITGCTRSVVRRWRQITGLSKKHPGPKRGKTRYEPVTLEVPENWDTPDWMSHAYTVVRSVRRLGILLGISKTTVHDKLRSYGIQHDPRNLKMPHPCRTRRWIQQHYVEQHLSTHKCAALAGVNAEMINSWLREFGIPLRQRGGEIHRRPPPGHPQILTVWGRQLQHLLRQTDIVNRVRVYERGFTVHYRTFLKEVYWYDRRESRKRAFPVTRASARLTRIPIIYDQYPERFGEATFPAHRIIQKRDWAQASLMERRVAFHRLLKELWNRGYERLIVPEAVLQSDLHRIRSSRKGRHVKRGGFVAYRGPIAGPGWHLMLHYFDLSAHLAGVWKSPRKLYAAMMDVARTTRTITTTEIMRSATFIYGPRVPPPTLWIDIFRHLNIQGTVADLYPGLGARALACSTLGLSYLTAPDGRFEAALSEGFGELIGLDWRRDNGRMVDLLVVDNGFTPVDVQAALAHGDRARQILVFVPHGGLRAVSELRPRALIRVRSRLIAKTDDFLALF